MKRALRLKPGHKSMIKTHAGKLYDTFENH